MVTSIRNGIKFESDLELNRYDYFKSKGVKFRYHLPIPFEVNLSGRKTYTPDFVIIDDDVAIIEETKGYDWGKSNQDAQLDAWMKALVKNGQDFLIEWLESNGVVGITEVKYRKIKYLKKEGWVDFGFKSPTLKDAWKKKALMYEKLNKELKKELKDYKRYISYKTYDNNKKLTKSQIEWAAKFEKDMKEVEEL